MYWHMARTRLLKTLVNAKEERRILRAARKNKESVSAFLRYAALLLAERPNIDLE